VSWHCLAVPRLRFNLQDSSNNNHRPWDCYKYSNSNSTNRFLWSSMQVRDTAPHARYVPDAARGTAIRLYWAQLIRRHTARPIWIPGYWPTQSSCHSIIVVDPHLAAVETTLPEMSSPAWVTLRLWPANGEPGLLVRSIRSAGDFAAVVGQSTVSAGGEGAGPRPNTPRTAA
jgi:hypothetical protein